MTDIITTAIALIVIAVNITVALKYRSLFKKYKRRYEELIKPPQPKNVSPQATKAQTDRERYLEIRSQILLRDHFRCQECGYYKHLEVHHIVPRSKGGTDDSENLVTLCQRCHGKKHGFRNRENRRKRHARRNRRKKENRWLNKCKKNFQEEPFIEELHPPYYSEESNPKRRQELYEKWKRNELNQT